MRIVPGRECSSCHDLRLLACLAGTITGWGENYFASTFHNVFLSRKGFLSAPRHPPAGAATCTSEMVVEIAEAGLYLPLVRYEAPFNFESMFRLSISQSGTEVYAAVMGGRSQGKVNGFRICQPGGHFGPHSLGPECRFGWGTTEAMVWQGTEGRVQLQKGLATVSLTIDAADLSPPRTAPMRNVDVVVLTSNLSDVATRLTIGNRLGNTPLDGMLRQQGDVFARVINRGPSEVNISLPKGKIHSSANTHIWFPTKDGAGGDDVTDVTPLLMLQAGPEHSGRSTSRWVEIGGLLDGLNSGEWQPLAAVDTDQPAPPGSACKYTEKPGTFLKGYATGSPTAGWSTLAAAQAWCCAHAGCGGVTRQGGVYTARAGKVAAKAKAVTSWLLAEAPFKLNYTLQIGVLDRSQWRRGQQLPDPGPQQQDVETIASFDVNGCPNYGTGSTPKYGMLPVPAWPLPQKLDRDRVAVCQGIVLTFDANTVGSRRIRRVEEQFLSVFRQVKAHNATLLSHLRPPNITTIVTVPSFTKVPTTITTDPSYNASIDSWHEMYGFTNLYPSAEEPTPSNQTESCARRMQYSSHRDLLGLNNDSQVLAMLEKAYGDNGPDGNIQECIGVFKLGDEISIDGPSASATVTQAEIDAGFVAHLKSQLGENASAAGCSSWPDCHYNVTASLNQTNPRLWYYSMSYGWSKTMQSMTKTVATVSRFLPHAGVGANFSPQPDYVGDSYQWIDCFRQGCLNMPWSEDYVWSVPLGSQQMMGLRLDMFRAGLRHKPEVPGTNRHKIHMYVMAHSPGQSAQSWRRQFFNHLGHGMKIVDLYSFTTHFGCTENYVDEVHGMELFKTVLTSLQELGSFETILQAGKVPNGKAGIYFSRASDVWGPTVLEEIRRATHPETHTPQIVFPQAKKALYIMLKHEQIAVDVLVEDDFADGVADEYTHLFLTDWHVSRNATANIQRWVAQGGTLFATSGAGLKDEFNQPNPGMEQLLGVTEIGTVADPNPIEWLKQDLPWAQPLDTFSITTDDPAGGADSGGEWSRANGQRASAEAHPVYGAVSYINASASSTVTARYANGSAAVVTTSHGKGRATYCGFLPGLSYFKTALPRRPVDRCNNDGNWSVGSGQACFVSADTFSISCIHHHSAVVFRS